MERLRYLTDNEDKIFFSTTTRFVLYFHVRNLHCFTHKRFKFLWGDWHRCWG
jgi:hypothetical protein